MRWLLAWSGQSAPRRVLLRVGLLVVPAGVGVLLANLFGPLAVLAMCVGGAMWAWATIAAFVTMPAVWTEPPASAASARRPAPCALCGYNCIPGGFWTPVPHDQNFVMHTMGCGPNRDGEDRLAAPTHWRHPDGVYVRY